MSQITKDTEVVTKNDLGLFYQKIYPYLNGAAHAGFTPVGTVIPIMSNHAPQNYLICDGTVYNIADYTELANHFETEFGSKNKFGGNGTTTFAVPDLRGEFLRGTGTNGHSREGSGSAVGTHQASTRHVRIHRDTNISVIGNTTNSITVSNEDAAFTSAPSGSRYVGANSYSESGNTTTSQYSARPTNTSVLYCIATHDIYIDARFDYSTTEKVVGTWIDGKPLYQKTIITTMPAVGQTSAIATLPSNVKKIINILACSAWRSGSESGYANVDGVTPVSNYVSNGARLYTSNNSIIVNNGNQAATGGAEVCITLQYTKTTDV